MLYRAQCSVTTSAVNLFRLACARTPRHNVIMSSADSPATGESRVFVHVATANLFVLAIQMKRGRRMRTVRI